MSTKTSRSGKKYSGSHTTIIPAAAIVADIAEKQPEVTIISLGVITAGLKPAQGHRRVKLCEWKAGVLLSVRDNTTHQEVRIYTRDTKATMLALARGARDSGLYIAFGQQPTC